MYGSNPIKVCILGSEASGKTCFLGALKFLSESNRYESFQVHGKDKQTDEYLSSLAGTLRRQAWPSSTHSTTELQINVTFDNDPLNLVILDYPGEDFRELCGFENLQNAKKLEEHLVSADYLLMFFDPGVDLASEKGLEKNDEDLLIKRKAAFYRNIDEILKGRKKAKKKTPNVAIVLSKRDNFPQLKDEKSALQFFKKQAGKLYKNIADLEGVADWRGKIKCFIVSSVGSTEKADQDVAGSGECLVPAKKLKPMGYEELFSWLIISKRRAPWLKASKIRKRPIDC